ncbi:hypothetical protein SSX86_001053 [Deinandra increscens subsp. villosa]|uniref:HMA domain-containing protein n=1 Tax=Deinandra increscens subsp. villosa TaxID=3103831 RepID=A0AAP0DVE1_9ASTR
MGDKDIVDLVKEAPEKKIVDADNMAKKVDEGPITVVLKLDLHCAGCAKKLKKSLQYIKGVETIKADYDSNKLTVTGKVDPDHIKERVEFKTKKKVEIISPKPKKDDGGAKKDDGAKPAEAKSNEKPKEPQSTIVVLKIPLHCDGCSQKIKRIISKIDGVELVKPDGTKNLVTVKGTMNTKDLIPYLKEKLKRNVDIVPSKKEEDKGGEKPDNKKKVEGREDKKEEKGNKDSDDKKKNDTEKTAVENSGGDEKKKKEGTINESEIKEKASVATNESEIKKSSNDEIKTTEEGGGSKGPGDEGKNVDVINKFEYYRHNNPYIYTMPVYNQSYHNQDYGVSGFSTQSYGYEGYANHGYVTQFPYRAPAPPSPLSLHDPRASETDLFGAENPNACSIM